MKKFNITKWTHGLGNIEMTIFFFNELEDFFWYLREGNFYLMIITMYKLFNYCKSAGNFKTFIKERENMKVKE